MQCCRNHSSSENGNCVRNNGNPIRNEVESGHENYTHTSQNDLNTSGLTTQDENNHIQNECKTSNLPPRTSSVSIVVPDTNHVIDSKQDSIKHSKTCSASLYIFNSKGKRCATLTNDYLDNQLGMQRLFIAINFLILHNLIRNCEKEINYSFIFRL